MKASVLGALVIVCGLILTLLARENSFIFQKCVADQQSQQTTQELKETPPRIIIEGISRTLSLRCTGRLINKMNAAITALATLAISVFTVVLVIVTNRQAKLTGDSVAIAKDALLKTERAFVFLDGFNIELTTALDSDHPDYERLPDRYKSDPGIYITRFAAQPRWKNGGSTPTEQMIIQVDWRGPIGTIPPEYVYRQPPEPFFLAPMAVEPSPYIEMPGAQALINWANNPVGEPPMMWIWGRADYRDVFGKPHFIEWCYQLRLSRPIRKERMTAAFIQWGDYNRSDKD